MISNKLRTEKFCRLVQSARRASAVAFAMICTAPTWATGPGDPTPFLIGLTTILLTIFSLNIVVAKRRLMQTCVWYVYVQLLCWTVGFQGFYSVVLPFLGMAAFFSFGAANRQNHLTGGDRLRAAISQLIGSRVRAVVVTTLFVVAAVLGVLGRTDRLHVWLNGTSATIVDVSAGQPKPIPGAIVQAIWQSTPYFEGGGAISLPSSDKERQNFCERGIFRSGENGEVTLPQRLTFELLNPMTRKATSAGTNWMNVFAPGYVSLYELFEYSRDDPSSHMSYPKEYDLWQKIRQGESKYVSSPESSAVAMVPDPRPLSKRISATYHWARTECDLPSNYATTLRDIVTGLVQQGASMGKADDPFVYRDERGCTVRKRCFSAPHGHVMPCDRDKGLTHLLSKAEALESPPENPDASITVEESEVLKCERVQ
jgi:hypothetical protein